MSVTTQDNGQAVPCQPLMVIKYDRLFIFQIL